MDEFQAISGEHSNPRIPAVPPPVQHVFVLGKGAVAAIISGLGLVVSALWVLSHTLFATESEAAALVAPVAQEVNNLKTEVAAHDAWAKEKTGSHSKEFDKLNTKLEQMRKERREDMNQLMRMVRGRR